MIIWYNIPLSYPSQQTCVCQGFYWSNEPRLKEIRRRSASHAECSVYYNRSEHGLQGWWDTEKSMSKLCIYQERELEWKAHYR